MYCKHCGKCIDNVRCLKECEHCGRNIDVDSMFCKYCGKPQEIGLSIRDCNNNEIKAGSLVWEPRTFKKYTVYKVLPNRMLLLDDGGFKSTYDKLSIDDVRSCDNNHR